MEALNYRLLCIDEGRQRLALVDTADRSWGWTLDLAELPLARDLQRLDRNTVLIGFDHGFAEIDLRGGALLRRCARWRGVTAAVRLSDGRTLVTGQDLAGPEQVNVLTLDPTLAVEHTATLQGNYVRLMRRGGPGQYLLCMDDHILEATAALAPLRRLSAPGFEHAWMAAREANGSTLVSGGYGAFMARFDADGNLRSTFGHAHQLPQEVAPFFYASFQQAPTGRLLVANWQGHGHDRGEQGRQLLEFDQEGKLTGSWSDPRRISSLQGILLL